MRKLVIPAFMALLFSQHSQAQTLFTYGNQPVSKDEFLRVYNKNTYNKKPDLSEAALREYLDLYSLFRMKVTEAHVVQLDTIKSINDELLNYRKQVAKSYLTDDALTAKLIQEAYDRKKEEVRVAHILVMMPRGGTPHDTMLVKNKIDSLYQLLITNKVSFDLLAQQASDDEGSKSNNGDIGYITSLQTVYPFEQAAFNTKKGTLSKPFRSQFGYHIIKVLDRRPSRGEVEVAQILITTPESKGEAGKLEARKKMDTVLQKIKKGVSFNELVQQYSDDRYSKEQNGVLPVFGSGKMIPAFEKAAFALKKAGDISEPITTEYGIHLIKLIRKIPLQPFDSLYSTLKRKVENDSRALTAKEAYLEKIKKDNGWQQNPQALEELIARAGSLPDSGTQAGVFDLKHFSGMNDNLFSIGGNNYSQSDFIKYMYDLTRGRLYGPRAAVVTDVFHLYTESVINDFLEQKLVENNTDFRLLMNDYKDGILLFELMDRKIWTAAAKDSVGLEKYYQNHRDNYQWEPGFKGVVYTLQDEETMKKAMELLSKKGSTPEDVNAIAHADGAAHAANYRIGYFEFSKHPEIPSVRLIEGKVSDAFRNNDGSYTIAVPEAIYPNGTSKSLDEARGFVISEYQEELEKEWNKQLRNKYPLTVDEKVFNSMVKK